MITQTFSSPMLAEGIGSVTSQFKKGGMIKKNSKKKKLSSKQLDIIETYAKGGKTKFSDGGKTMNEVWEDYRIADQYDGKKPEDIWFRLSKSQKRHLLLDHANIPSGDVTPYIGDDTKFDELPQFIKQIVKKHFSEGQYAKGGKIATYEVHLEAIPNRDFDQSYHEAQVRIPKIKKFAKTIDDAVKITKKFIQDNDLGGGNFLPAKLFENGKEIGFISYNGRVWNNDNSEMKYAKGGEVEFIEYKDHQIMYEPNMSKYYANDVEFNTLEDAQNFLDSGKMSRDLRGAYERGLFAKGGKLGKIIKNTQPTPTLSPKQIRLANEIAKEVVKTGLDATIKYDRSSIDIEIIYGNKFSESLSKGLFRVFWSRTGDNNIQYLGVGVGHYDGYQIKRGWSNDININEVQHFVKKDKDYYDSRKSVYAKGGTTDPKPTAQDILKRLGYNIPQVEESEEEEPKIIRGWVDDEPYYYKKGGRFGDDTPKVYIADLSEYNNGRLVGKWFDLTDYSDGAELMADIQEMLDEQTKKDKYGDVHEEWAVHDYENFPREFYSEYMGEADFDKLIKLINDTEDSGLPFDVISQAMAELGRDEVSDVVEAYFGSVSPSMGNEWRDFAHEYIDSIGSIEDAISNPEYYFDFDSFGREARWDFTEEEEKEMGYEDMSDEELGEELAEQMGGVENLGEMTLKNYFDYDKFGRELKYDFTAIRGEDGDYYFFYSNYKKGGSLRSKPEPEDDGEYVLSDEEKQIIRGYVDDEPYYFADGGEVTADERKKSLKGYPKLKF